MIEGVHVVQTSLGEIEYSIRGKGTPVLVCHGGHSNCKETLTQRGIDPQGCLIICPSRPGYGKTPLGNHLSPEKTADLFVALLEHLPIAEVDLVGISAGGPTAISLAARYPQKVNRLLLLSAISKEWLLPHHSSYKRAQILFRPGLEKFTWMLLRLGLKWAPKMIAQSMFQDLSTIKNPTFDEAEIADIKSMLIKQQSGHGFLADLEHKVDQSLLSSIEALTLIVHSKQDYAVKPEHAENAHQKIANSELFWVENKWGHLIWMGEGSEKAIEKIGDFLR